MLRGVNINMYHESRNYPRCHIRRQTAQNYMRLLSAYAPHTRIYTRVIVRFARVCVCLCKRAISLGSFFCEPRAHRPREDRRWYYRFTYLSHVSSRAALTLDAVECVCVCCVCVSETLMLWSDGECNQHAVGNAGAPVSLANKDRASFGFLPLLLLLLAAHRKYPYHARVYMAYQVAIQTRFR